MADTVEQNMEEISKLRESNEIYFSDSILEALGRQSINQVNFREKVTEIFYTISVRLPEYYDKYENFERLLKDLLVQLKLYQGFIGEIHGNRLLICSKLADFENVMFFFGRENPDIQAVFDKTSVQISVVGEGERYSFSVTLTEKDRERRLTEYHHSVKGFLLATAQAVRNDKAASLCCVGILNDGEYVYEINMDNKNRRKKLIRGLMREAVELYSKGNYRQARFLFARVLMKNPGNAAAAYYIRSIDDVINEGRNVGWL
jgi:tetratricopeptide (TPR) repeat protein